MAVQKLTLESALSSYGRAVKAKLNAVMVQGEPEEQLRAPLESLLRDLAELCGLSRNKVTLVGETRVAHLQTRPDYAVTYNGSLVGFIEIKAPGKGADPRRFRGTHDKEQWQKLKALPNLLYTDGQSFALWRGGERQGDIRSLSGDLYSAGAALTAPAGLLLLFEDFLRWNPIPPESPEQLADVSARLCRFLRDEVSEQMANGEAALTALARDWRDLLFPEATDAEFADGYAQTVTFGLLLARAKGISLDNGVDTAARTLANTHSLIGAALRLLTDQVVVQEVLATSVQTLSRMLAVVDWPTISKGEPDAWLYFYEHFLAEYDNELRKLTGSYYTPVEVVKSMTRLVEEALRDRFGLADGLASSDVTVVDPAVGTGTFLLEVVRSIATTAAEGYGEGAVADIVALALKRLIGFEIQLGPFAVAQLRIIAELAELDIVDFMPNDLRMYVTNTLDNPFVEEQWLGSWYEPIAEARRRANKIKREEPVTVVIGNPPYRVRSRGKGGWVESGNLAASQLPPLEDFLPPSDWGVSAHVKHIHNMYVYFWRWAIWKVFDHHKDADRGVICFITPGSFLEGPGFQQMRAYMRRRADAIWVLDCTPEGQLLATNHRIFEGVKEPVSITILVRAGATKTDQPAQVFYRSLAAGRREDKFSEMEAISLNDQEWEVCPEDWRAPFRPALGVRWASFLEFDDIFRWSGSGVMPGRTWVIAPDKDTLRRRWSTLIAAKDEDKPGLFSEHKRDRRVDSVISSSIPGFPATKTPIGKETGPCPEPVQIGYRSFDRQWIIPDKRLINRPNPKLWSLRSSQQVFLTVLNRTSPKSGPAVTASAHIPDIDHYHGKAGRVFPLWLDARASVPNIVPGLLEHLANIYKYEVSGSDLFAYVAGLLAHPEYSSFFAEDLRTAGVRVPLTKEPGLFQRIVEVGRRVLWLHTYGQAFYTGGDDRPKRAPRLPGEKAPKVLGGFPIPSGYEGMPDELTHDSATGVLHVGAGRISNVTSDMFNYNVSGMNVLAKWFSYRRKNRDRPLIGGRRVSPLLEIQAESWKAEYTTELIDLLNVIGLLVELEREQADLLASVVQGPIVTADDLTEAGVLPVPATARKPPADQVTQQPGMLDFEI